MSTPSEARIEAAARAVADWMNAQGIGAGPGLHGGDEELARWVLAAADAVSPPAPKLVVPGECFRHGETTFKDGDVWKCRDCGMAVADAPPADREALTAQLAEALRFLVAGCEYQYVDHRRIDRAHVALAAYDTPPPRAETKNAGRLSRREAMSAEERCAELATALLMLASAPLPDLGWAP